MDKYSYVVRRREIFIKKIIIFQRSEEEEIKEKQ